MHHYFIKEKVEKRDFVLVYISSENNISDLLTKPLLRDAMGNFARNLG